MNKDEFEQLLNTVCARLKAEAGRSPFKVAKDFESRVREVVQDAVHDLRIRIDFDPHPQAFPDIAVGQFGIEVKFTTNDTWRSVANSVLERNRIEDVRAVYLVFGKMGGVPDVKWGEYEKCVMHVRTSHVPRFEVELFPAQSLFDRMGISYYEFRRSSMEEKMRHVRAYARSRLQPGERLWWLEDSAEPEHTLPIQVRLYMKLSKEEKTRLRAEAAILCPQIVKPANARDKYNDAVLYILTYHGVMCPQGRDLFSAGSVANPKNDDAGGRYLPRSLKLLEVEMLEAAARMEDALFVEYWGEAVEPSARIERWLQKADEYAQDWTPSAQLFLDYQRARKR